MINKYEQKLCFSNTDKVITFLLSHTVFFVFLNSQKRKTRILRRAYLFLQIFVCSHFGTILLLNITKKNFNIYNKKVKYKQNAYNKKN